MGNTTFDEGKVEGMKVCAGAQGELPIPETDCVRLSVAQLEPVAGGVSNGWSLDQLLSSLDEKLGKLLPEGIDPRLVWFSVPTFAGH